MNRNLLLYGLLTFTLVTANPTNRQPAKTDNPDTYTQNVIRREKTQAWQNLAFYTCCCPCALVTFLLDRCRDSE